MERSRNALSSAVGTGVGIGMGIGVGLGLVSARLLRPCWGSSRGPTPAELEAELRRLVVDGCKSGVTFADFPYYICEEMRTTLTSVAYPYLNATVAPERVHAQAKTSRTILLCSQSEFNMQSLAKALAHQFNARLLILDVLELAKQIKHKYDCPENARAVIGGTSDSTLDRLYKWIERHNFLSKKVEPTGSSRHGKGILDFSVSDESLLPGSKGHDDSKSQEDIEFVHPSWYVDERILMRTLHKVVASVSVSGPVILYIRDVNIFLGYSERVYSMFQNMLNNLSGRVLIIGSHFISGDSDQEMAEVHEAVSDLFTYILRTKPPEGKALYKKWKAQMDSDYAKVNTDIFVKIVTDVLSANNLECDDLSSVSPKDYKGIHTELFEIVPLAVSYHLMNEKNPKYRHGKLVISSTSLSQGLRIFEERNRKNLPKDQSKQFNATEYEKKLRGTVVPAGQIGVTFDDIGALNDIKESVEELVMLPLQRPDLFNGGLLKPCKGILLFGPPGTGKTMLAKAIANQAGASFINVSSTSSFWSGNAVDAEKKTRALFSLAVETQPAIIFLDEVDSIFGNESVVSSWVKNEFMLNWDMLLSISIANILIIAATKRPFDLDEGIIRRFDHRIMVGLPTLESRELILKKLLSKEKVENIDFEELARLTEGYTGSDLKNLCMTAAYRPMREVLQKENEMNKDKKVEQATVMKDGRAGSSQQKRGKDAAKEEEQAGEPKMQGGGNSAEKGKLEKGALRPLTMEDLKQAKAQVGPSFRDGVVMKDIKQWNELYDSGMSRKWSELTYFL